ncbi:unnamed protein product [Caenorhabditis nigoni]
MRKLLISLSLLLTVTANASAKKTQTNALHAIIEKFESLSRITNGLALQKELNSKSLNIDYLLAEILGIDPENSGFEELRMIKMDDLSKRYAELSNDAGGVKKSSIDESMVKSQLDVLGKMEEDLEVMRKGETLNLDEVLDKRKKVFATDTSMISEKFHKFPSSLNNTFNQTGDDYNDQLFTTSFKELHTEIPTFWSMVKALLNFEITFKDIWAINGSFSQLGPLRALGKVADVYNNTYANLTKLKDNLEALNKDIPILIPFIEKSSEIRNLNKDLGKLYGMFEKFSIPNPSTRLLTAGLTRGTQDIKSLFQDVNAQWFKKSVANENEKILKRLISDMTGLKVLSEDMAKTEAIWDNFKNRNDIIKVKKSFNSLDEAKRNVINIDSFQTLQSSSSQVGGCLMNLRKISVDVDFKVLNQGLDKLDAIEKAATEMKPFAESEVSEFMTYGIYGGSGLIFIAILIGFIFLARWILNDRKRADPNYYIHLLNSGDESELAEGTICGKPYQCYPIHQAIRDRNIDALKRSIMNGANVNAYVQQHGTWWTPLHIAVDLNSEEMQKLLIMNGADVNLRDCSYKTPEECLLCTKDSMFKKFEGKTFRRRLPKQFPKSKWLIYAEGFSKRKHRTVDKAEMATHISFWNEEDNQIREIVNIDDLISKNPDRLKFFFQNVMIMKPSWSKNCKKWWHPWIPADYKHRVTKVCVNGKVYETVAKIHQHTQERRIPFLHGVAVNLGGLCDEKERYIQAVLESLVRDLGVENVDCGGLPNPGGDMFQNGEGQPAKPYYFDNMGHCWIIVGSKMTEIKESHPEYFTCNRFSVMTVTEFMEFIFKFEPHHYQLSGKEDATTFKTWQPFVKADQKK